MPPSICSFLVMPLSVVRNQSQEAVSAHPRQSETIVNRIAQGEEGVKFAIANIQACALCA